MTPFHPPNQFREVAISLTRAIDYGTLSVRDVHKQVYNCNLDPTQVIIGLRLQLFYY